MQEYSDKFERKTNLPERNPGERRWKLTTLERTCMAVPSQWEATWEFSYVDSGPKLTRHVYIRYRGGRFAVGVSDESMEAAIGDNRLSPLITWYSDDPEDRYDGTMHDLDMLHLISEYFEVEPWVEKVEARMKEDDDVGLSQSTGDESRNPPERDFGSRGESAQAAESSTGEEG